MNAGAVALKAWRRRENLTRPAAAERLGLSLSSIERLELASRRPSLELAVQLQDALGILPSDWTQEEPEP